MIYSGTNNIFKWFTVNNGTKITFNKYKKCNIFGWMFVCAGKPNVQGNSWMKDVGK